MSIHTPGTVKAYVPLFAITLILSAFLLFSVQPLFSKMVLPLLGGSPGVWNTAMVFFQAMLLGGYAYAHLSTKFLQPRTQAVLHVALLAFCIVVLPIAIPESWAHPPATENPIPWMLGLMAVAVGAPFFVLAGTAPMLQRWFSTTDHPDAHNPYFLYAASNFGSMAALISYPLVIEPLLGLQQQSHYWMYGFITLIALIAVAGLQARKIPAPLAFDPHQPANSTVPTNRMRLIWLALAFIPSSLMLGVTTYVTTDVASAPLLWVIPLALYLLTFIIVFSRFTTLSVRRAYGWQSVAVTLVALLFIRDPFMVKAVNASLHLVTFFFCALTCHLALAHRRPTPQYLTEFYLIMSLGGVLGGVFNSLLAPYLFILPLEYTLVLAASMVIPFVTGDLTFYKREVIYYHRFIIIGVVAALAALFIVKSSVITLSAMGIVFYCLLILRRRYSALIVTLLLVLAIDPGFNWRSLTHTLHIERNFFGVIRVDETPNGQTRSLYHGTTLHGTQMQDEEYRLVPISYYAPTSPGGQVFEMVARVNEGKAQKMAILGLGLGSVACYPAPERDFVFYEIDPAIKRVAEDKSLFTYLSDCGSPYEVIMGDGRLRIAEAPDGSYDMIFLDAFSSDSIPIHLLTREAFQLYFRKLKPEGLLVVHISNRYLDLAPLVAAQAEDANARVWLNSIGRGSLGKLGITVQGSNYGIMSKGDAMAALIDTEFKQWKAPQEPKIRPWTDDYANFFYLMWLKIQNVTAGKSQ